jgi:MFS family permease
MGHKVESDLDQRERSSDDRGLGDEKAEVTVVREQNGVDAFESRALDLKTILALFVSTFMRRCCWTSEQAIDQHQALSVTYEASLFAFSLPGNVLLSINAAIGPSADIGWAATAWALGNAVVTTIAGRCSDIFGRRYYFLGGNLLGIIGCAIAAKYVHRLATVLSPVLILS